MPRLVTWLNSDVLTTEHATHTLSHTLTHTSPSASTPTSMHGHQCTWRTLQLLSTHTLQPCHSFPTRTHEHSVPHSLHSAIPLTQTGRKQMCHLLGPVSNLCWWWISPISPHAAPEYSETKASYEITLSLGWLLWLDTGTGLAICLALTQRNDMIKTNYHVF